MNLPQEIRMLMNNQRKARTRRPMPRNMALYFVACALAMVLVLLAEPNE